ncbi:Uncharacterised protein [Nocardia asteroides]|nr:Uncharacterised protein [Nocardia asteroides]
MTSGESGPRLRCWAARAAFLFAAMTALIPVLFAGWWGPSAY